ncbi:O-antigen ligase family protein [Lacinutrix jangbogonensis]|uniref:O-antigen ligase family protein n=1 Tax=Lacinutrix jangbogonensis TaxID=1469557 RepID=UPI00138E252F|nr:O-antigen ligase family protein [Lacinutrix jangbogonensis]
MSKVSRENIFKYLSISIFIYNLLLIIVAFYRQISKFPDFSKINWYFFSYRGLLKYFYVHATYLGLINNVVLLFILFTFGEFSKKEKLFSIFIMLSSVLITMLSGSRIQFLITILILILFLISRLTIKRAVIFSLFISFSFIVLSNVPIVKERVIDTVFSPHSKFEYAVYGDKPGESASVSRRLSISFCGLESIKDNWLFGYGSNYVNKSKLLHCYQEKGLKNAFSQKFNTHNQYIGLILIGGLPLLLLFMFMFIKLFYISILNYDYIYIGFLIIITITCVTENIFERHFGIVFFSIINSLLYFFNKKPSTSNVKSI